MRPTSSREAAEVHAVAEALRQAVNASDVNGIVACWAPDGIMLPPNHPAVHGTANIRAYFDRAFASRRLAFTFTDSGVDVLGDTAVERLQYTVVAMAPNGEATEDAGKGIHFYTRRPDRSWQIALDIWNSDRPSQTAPATDGR